jgi:predicted dehydrogenase
MIELRRPLKLPIGWTLTAQTRRGEAQQGLEADATPGGATANFLAALRGEAPVACSFADAVISTAIVEQAFASARSGGEWRPLG